MPCQLRLHSCRLVRVDQAIVWIGGRVQIRAWHLRAPSAPAIYCWPMKTGRWSAGSESVGDHWRLQFVCLDRDKAAASNHRCPKSCRPRQRLVLPGSLIARYEMRSWGSVVVWHSGQRIRSLKIRRVSVPIHPAASRRLLFLRFFPAFSAASLTMAICEKVSATTPRLPEAIECQSRPTTMSLLCFSLMLFVIFGFVLKKLFLATECVAGVEVLRSGRWQIGLVVRMPSSCLLIWRKF